MEKAKHEELRTLSWESTGLELPFHALEGGRAQITGIGSAKYRFSVRFSRPPYLVVSKIGWWEITIPIINVKIYLPVPVFLQGVDTEGFTIFKPLPGTFYVNYIAFGPGGWWG